MIDPWIGASAILLLSFGLRAYPGMLSRFDESRRYVGANDSYTVLTIIDRIRENDHRFPDSYPNYLPRRPIGYPLLMHWTLSFLGEETVDRMLPYWGAIVETVHALVVMGFAHVLVTKTAYGLVVPSLPGTLLPGLVFALAPILVQASHGPGLIFSARPLGSILLTLALLPVLGWLYTGQVWLVVLAVPPLVAVLLTHKFATQAAWFVFASLSAVTASPLPLALLLGATVLATVVTRGYYARVVHSHVAHVRYWTTLQFLPKWGPEPNRALLDVLGGEPIRSVVRDLAPTSYTWFWRNELTYPYAYSPAILLPILVVATRTDFGAALPLLGWLFALVFAHLVVLLPGLRYVGAPGRYFQYAVAPTALLVPYAVYRIDLPLAPEVPVSGPWLVLGLVVAYAALLAAREVRLTARVRTEDESSTDSFGPLREWLVDREPERIVTIPTYLSKHVLPYADHDFLRPRAPDHTGPDRRAQTSETLEFISAPNPDLDRLRDMYDLEYAVFDREYVDEVPVEYEEPDEEPLYADDRFVVYRLRPGGAEA